MKAGLVDQIMGKYEVGDDPAILETIRAEFAAALQGADLDERVVRDLVMILDEGLANVIGHGRGVARGHHTLDL